MLRLIRCVNGEVQVLLDCEPSFNYGEIQANWEYTGPSYHEARATGEGTDLFLDLTTDMRIGFEGPRATGRTLMKEGETPFVALWSEHAPPRNYEDAYDRSLFGRRTTGSTGSTTASFPTTPWHPPPALGAHAEGPVLCAHRRPGGGGHHLAAGDPRRQAQLGLPLHLDPRRHLHALGPLHARLRLGGQRLLLLHRRRRGVEQGQLQIMYGIDGEAKLPEQTLDHLSATRAPGRCGSAAAPTTRTSTTSGARSSTRSTCTPARARPPAGADLADPREPGRDGARELAPPRPRHLEVRGELQHFTSSKLMCWVAADRGARLAEIREELEYAARWQSAADEIKADICENALDDRDVFTQHYGTDALDASVLLMPLVRFLPPEDERIRKTVLAIADELTEQGLVLRYRVEETDDGLSGEEGTLRSAPSGSWPRWWRSASSSGLATSARRCSPTPARSASTPRRSIPPPGVTSATSPRPSPTWP